MDDITHLRLVVVAFEGFASLVQYNKNENMQHMGLLLASVRYYMVLGLPGFYELPQLEFEPLKNTSIMNKLGSSSSQQTAFNQTLFGLKLRSKEEEGYDSDFESDSEKTELCVKTPDESFGVSESQSDFVDIRDLIGNHKSEFSLITESNKSAAADMRKAKPLGRDLSKLTGVCNKVRTVALNCLLEVLKLSPPKLTFGYWWHFIPDESIVEFFPSEQPFFYLLLKDKNVRSRTQALNCLSQFLILGRHYILAAADDRHDPKAYTSYSYTLAASVKELHRVLVQITSLDYGFVTLPVALQVLLSFFSIFDFFKTLAPRSMSVQLYLFTCLPDHIFTHLSVLSNRKSF